MPPMFSRVRAMFVKGFLYQVVMTVEAVLDFAEASERFRYSWHCKQRK